jgi:hypothetical protein
LAPALLAYIEHGTALPPGSFLDRLVRNQLVEAVFAAGHDSHRICEWAYWLRHHCEPAAWGSPAKVDAWIDNGGLQRIHARPLIDSPEPAAAGPSHYPQRDQEETP